MTDTTAITIDLFGASWILVKTTAPASYDYHWGITIYEGPKDDYFRLVLLRGDRQWFEGFQLPRYQSGLFHGELSTEYSAEEVQDHLFQMAASAEGLHCQVG